MFAGRSLGSGGGGAGFGLCEHETTQMSAIETATAVRIAATVLSAQREWVVRQLCNTAVAGEPGDPDPTVVEVGGVVGVLDAPAIRGGAALRRRLRPRRAGERELHRRRRASEPARDLGDTGERLDDRRDAALAGRVARERDVI